MAGPWPAPRAWLVTSLAAAPWLFWTCPPCWVLALLPPVGTAVPEAGRGDGTASPS